MLPNQFIVTQVSNVSIGNEQNFIRSMILCSFSSNYVPERVCKVDKSRVDNGHYVSVKQAHQFSVPAIACEKKFPLQQCTRTHRAILTICRKHTANSQWIDIDDYLNDIPIESLDNQMRRSEIESPAAGKFPKSAKRF